jgi:hypothetical protein
MVIVKRFSGIMDTDSKEQDVLAPNHISARNARFFGGPNGLTLQNIKGNVIISNSSLPPGTNECVGSFYDQVGRRIIWFNYHNGGAHGIYQYSFQTGAVTQLFRCLVNSATDILNFSLDYPVHSAALVYRTSGDGDLLYWTDGLNRPRYLNLDTVSALSPFTSDMLNAAKNAPLAPPTSAYQNDATVNSNALRKKLFRFRYRWVYKNGEKSTWSPISKVPLPVNDDDTTVQNDPTQNNNIAVTMTAGGSDYQSIELAVQESLGQVWSDFALVDNFDRDEYAINPDASFVFDFYNDGAYPTVDVRESDLLFDFLPDKANTLELLNGNVLIYGGITDGYDPMAREDVDVEITATSINPPSDYGAAYKWNGNYRFGLVYYDDRGKSNGVVSFVADPVDTTDFSVATPGYAQSGSVTQINQINASINHTPPTWAEKYQWVRTPNLGASKFIYYTTSDYQVDGNFSYFSIQSLVVNKKENTGFIPGYEFSPGDRIRVVGRWDGANLIFVPYNVQLDLEILGIIERTMTSPAETGLFLKTVKPTTLPSLPFQSRMIVEIYTPAVKADDSAQVFYEFGECYDIYESGGQRFHRGQIQDQTAIQPATFQWTDGDVYYRQRTFYSSIFALFQIRGLIMDANYSDFFASAVNSNGRGWVIDENAKLEYNSVLSRWGGKYQSGTNINQINRFYPEDFDEADRSKGDIRRFKVRDRILRVFQDRGVGQYGVYARFIQNNSGEQELVTTNEIITTNNIQYYVGNYGVGGYPTNLGSAQIADYFIDVVTGRAIRLSGDGMTDLGLLYKGQFYLSQLATPYNKTLLRSDGSKAKIINFFNFFENECHFILQAGTVGGVTTENQNFSFNEGRNGFCSFYDFHPEWAMSASDITFSWKNGQLYRHDSDTRCNFYGLQYGVDATFVFNDNLAQKKTWQSITEISSNIFACPSIYTNSLSYGSQRQESTLVEAEFVKYENNPSASLKRDSNSIGGKVNGDFLKGNIITIKFQKLSASAEITLSELLVQYADSPLTTR